MNGKESVNVSPTSRPQSTSTSRSPHLDSDAIGESRSESSFSSRSGSLTSSKSPVRVSFQDGTTLSFAFEPATPVQAMKQEIIAGSRKKQNIKLISDFDFKLIESGVILSGVESMQDIMEANQDFSKTEQAKRTLSLTLVKNASSPPEDDTKEIPARVRLPNWTYVTVKVRCNMTIAEAKRVLEDKTMQKADILLLSMDHYKLKLRSTGHSFANEQNMFRDVLLLDVIDNQPMHQLLELSLEHTGNFPSFPIHEGPLNKQRDVFKVFDERYFRLTSLRFSWYKKRTDKDERNGFPIGGLQVKLSASQQGSGKSFSVECEGKSIHLQGSSEEVCREWLMALDTAIQMFRSHREPVGVFRSKLVAHQRVPEANKRENKFVAAVAAKAVGEGGGGESSSSVTDVKRGSSFAADITSFDLNKLISCVTLDDTTAKARPVDLCRAIGSSVGAQLREIQNFADSSSAATQMPFVGKSSMSSTDVSSILSPDAIQLLASSNAKPLPIVLDFGSWEVRAGFAGYHSAVCAVPSICGRLRQATGNRPFGGIPILTPQPTTTTTTATASQQQQQQRIFSRQQRPGGGTSFVGSDALSRRGILSLRYPISEGRVVDWDDLEAVLEFTLMQALKVVPEDHELLITQPLVLEPNTKSKLGELLFETLNVQGCYVAPQHVLAMYGTASMTALVVDVGDDHTRCVAMLNGHVVKGAERTFVIGGKKLTDYFIRLMSECTSSVASTISSSDFRNFSELKERKCYVAVDFGRQQHEIKSSKVELADGREVVVTDQVIRCTELMFVPELFGHPGQGLHHVISDVLSSCPAESRPDLCNKIVLVGGSASFAGFADRLTAELQKILGIKCRVVVPSNPKQAVWRGGSVLASIPAFESKWVTSEAYFEVGASAL